MNGVFFMCSLPLHLEVVAALKRRGVRFDLLDVAEHNCGSRSDYAQLAPEAEVLDSFRLYSAELPEGVPPIENSVDEATIRYLAPYEGAALQMMDRRNGDGAPVQELRELFLRYAALWQKLLERHRPSAVVFHGTPHQGHDFVLYHLCRRAGVRTLMLERTFLNERMFVRSHLEDCLRPDESEWPRYRDEERLRIAQTTATIEPALADDRKTHYETLNRRINNLREIRYRISVPYLVKEIFDVRYWHGLRKPVTDSYYGVAGRRPSMFEYRRADWDARWIARRGLKAYERLAVRPDLQCDYVYLALHYQPERTTIPDGGQFSDQFNVARVLAESLPDGWRLYVREHPRQFRRPLIFSKVRSEGYYERLAAIPRVTLVSLDFPAADLIRRSRAAATVTGSTAWEAVQQSRPGLVFGNAWYLHCPGVIRINGAATCRAALSSIAGGSHRVDPTDVAAFARWMNDRCFRGCFTEGILKLSGLSYVENGELIAAAVYRELQTTASFAAELSVADVR